jgi:hypothetical protein
VVLLRLWPFSLLHLAAVTANPPHHLLLKALLPQVLLLLLLLTGRLSLPSMTFCGSKLKLLTTSTGAKPSPARPGGSGRTNCRQQT